MQDTAGFSQPVAFVHRKMAKSLMQVGRTWLLLTLCLAACWQPVSAGAQDAPSPVEARASQIAEVLSGELLAEEVFSENFLRAVPASQLEQIARKLSEQGGDLIGIEQVVDRGNGAAEFRLRYERALGQAQLQLSAEPPYKIVGFRVSSLTPVADTAEEILTAFAELPGEAGFAIYRLGDDGPDAVLANDNALRPMAIGSTFKLYVLAALSHEIMQGNLAWSDVVTLDQRSLPSGQMQDWPAGAPVTLQTLATMMISISDNTATDRLMELLGRDRIAQAVIRSGHANPQLPLMTTAEMFALKLASPEARNAWREADDTGRQAILDRLDTALLDVAATNAAFASGPVAPDIEWFASSRDIARLLDSIRRSGDEIALAILRINPSIPPELRGHWSYVGYKGGSEPGVLNLSWLLQDNQGEWLVVTASWTDVTQAVDLGRLELLCQRLVLFAAASQ